MSFKPFRGTPPLPYDVRIDALEALVREHYQATFDGMMLFHGLSPLHAEVFIYRVLMKGHPRAHALLVLVELADGKTLLHPFLEGVDVETFYDAARLWEQRSALKRRVQDA